MTANELGKRVAEARTLRAWSQDDLAEAAGVSTGTISNFERGKSRPQPPKLRAILAALDMEAAEDEQAAESRSDWPADVKTFLDLMGLFLVSMDEDQRVEVMYDLTRQIVSRPRK